MSQPREIQLDSKFKLAAVLIATGLLVQIGTLLMVNPLAFVAFLVIGCPLMLAGVWVYLRSLL